MLAGEPALIADDVAPGLAHLSVLTLLDPDQFILGLAKIGLVLLALLYVRVLLVDLDIEFGLLVSRLGLNQGDLILLELVEADEFFLVEPFGCLETLLEPVEVHFGNLLGQSEILSCGNDLPLPPPLERQIC